MVKPEVLHAGLSRILLPEQSVPNNQNTGISCKCSHSSSLRPTQMTNFGLSKMIQ
ncbi:hypothetical protein EX30DRAFT_339746 [Ascodesmis nigricans]|uniref:Uncharacterized protein n=1 Tax=Ascodesmis nigricans TaxID=341454 RepID=A0A4S2N0H7_9PEZI|nr:hypothetical protein EX30DRAFT_339746 [Ascodesmis nigricans]